MLFQKLRTGSDSSPTGIYKQYNIQKFTIVALVTEINAQTSVSNEIKLVWKARKGFVRKCVQHKNVSVKETNPCPYKL